MQTSQFSVLHTIQNGGPIFILNQNKYHNSALFIYTPMISSNLPYDRHKSTFVATRPALLWTSDGGPADGSDETMYT